MAGAKGKSGGPRPNSGGARPNAGRKRKDNPEKSANEPPEDKVMPPADQDMLTFLQNVALGITEASNVQVRAAIAAVQYTHTKKGDGGKKEEKQAAAEKAATGKFGLRAVK